MTELEHVGRQLALSNVAIAMPLSFCPETVR